MKTLLLSFFMFLFGVAEAHAKTVHYDLVARRGSINLSGKKSVNFALMINGSIPAPTLEFTEGDEAEIVVKNEIPDEELSIHWHGILLPPEMDGVPYVTTPPIYSGSSFTFRFKIRQSGTYWYHSHTNVQEQEGLYGALLFHPEKKTIAYDRDVVAVLSDWSDEKASKILKNLRKDGDYYLYKKGTIRSYGGALGAGALSSLLSNEWTRMGGMDLSDVGYDAFLINGRKKVELTNAKPGERVRLRIINAGASTYFNVALGNEPMDVISADGVDIEPIKAKTLLMGMAETYDVLVRVPDSKRLELRATAQDGTGFASGWIGKGEIVHSSAMPPPDLYATMNHSGHEDHSQMDHSLPTAPPGEAIELLTVDQYRALQPTSFPNDAHVHDVKLVLDGDMSRYIWHINGKAMYQDRNIVINAGDVVRFTLVNETMMHHPIHLHGHFFRVVTAAGEFSPLKHTVDVPPHMTRTIEFRADEPGEWMLHCHNLFHMKSGMARVVKYSSFSPSPEMLEHQKHDHHMHDHWYFYGMLEAVSNHAQGLFRLSQTWNEIDGRVESRKDYDWNVEADLFYRRWFNRYFNLVLGFTEFDKNYRGAGGVGYTWPMLVKTAFLIDHTAKFRIDAEKKFQWAKYVFTDADMTWRQDEGIEYEVSLMVSPIWALALGVKFTGESFGGGIQYQF